MLTTCMKYKTIKNFLLNYNESRWSRLIPSLLEIAILNLHISFKTNFFSEKDLEIIINDLKLNFKKKLRNNEINNTKNLDEIIIEKSNKEYMDKNKKRKKTGKSRSKEREINDEYEYYDNEKPKKNNTRKSNYAISYDKNLRPEIIEKTELKSKKEGKIIKRMTEEEYNAQYDSQGEEREIKDNDNNKKNKKSKNKKSKKKNFNYEQMQIPDQDEQNQNFREYNSNMENIYQDENEQEFNNNEDDDYNNGQKGFYDQQGNYHEFEEQNVNMNKENQYEENNNDIRNNNFNPMFNNNFINNNIKNNPNNDYNRNFQDNNKYNDNNNYNGNYNQNYIQKNKMNNNMNINNNEENYQNENQGIYNNGNEEEQEYEDQYQETTMTIMKIFKFHLILNIIIT